MAIVQQLLKIKGPKVHSIGRDATVLDALKLMADRDIGSVLVMDGDRLSGIFTERHYARNVFLKGKASPTTLMRDVMDTAVMCVRPDQTIEECMDLMTDKRIRHLPVLEGGRVIGIISIGDLMKSMLGERESTIDQLQTFIRG